MFYVVKYLYGLLAQQYADHADPRVKDWPLVYSPVIPVSIIALYLLFVLKYGPKWMENRQPFELKNIMRVYNVIQVIANLVLFVCAIPNSYGHRNFSFRCQPPEPTNTEPWMMNCLYVTYGYYLTKYLDLFDTIFIVLRKKTQQVTFLHVYHHAGMVLGVHLYITFFPGSHSTMLGVINLLVHTVMYGYYFIASVRPSTSSLWWKRYITQMQLAQFAYLAFHFLQVVVNNSCNHPFLIAIVGFMQNIFMFSLFFEFYYRTYMRKDKKVNTAAVGVANEKQLKSS
ncbi:elongation of very long chain fatty acids protein AAEL008004 [Musca domestica]|uniref:Elongation of very long chain fatty acids protein n=1 Tax=Musca domestica TaxID=7370 RepID=A0A9J7D2G8_MUSDO|nr:elongation of very long chain fatty acids protein AAEL008004 [Musca domestica]XP_058977478.1 elongation of very long chain fatty acids protein AAEL008004 [Musca domestica]